MSEIVCESAARTDSSSGRRRGVKSAWAVACSPLVRRVPAGALVAAAVLVVASSSAAYAVIALTPKPVVNAVVPQAPAEAPANPAANKTRAKCSECAIVESVRELAPTADHPPTRAYEVTLRMNDGSHRQLLAANPAHWRLGERVIVIAESSRLRD